MDVTWKVTEADRDSQGNIKLNSEPRSLADLLPNPEAIKQDAKRRQPWARSELADLAVVALCAITITAYAWWTPTAAPTPRQTAVPTFQPTAAPTTAPVTP